MPDPYVSRIKSSQLDELFTAILKLKNEEECYRFFEDLCTIPELHSISQRWLVARELDSGTTYQDISNQTKASTATISRVNRALFYGSGGYRLVLERMKSGES